MPDFLAEKIQAALSMLNASCTVLKEKEKKINKISLAWKTASVSVS